MNVDMCMHVHICVLCMFVFAYVYVCVCMCMCFYVCACLSVHAPGHSNIYSLIFMLTCKLSLGCSFLL